MASTELLQHEDTWHHFTTLLKLSAVGLVCLGLAAVAAGVWA